MYLLLTPRKSELYYFDTDFYSVYFNSYKEMIFLILGVGVTISSEIIKAKHAQNFVHNFWVCGPHETHPGKEIVVDFFSLFK